MHAGEMEASENHEANEKERLLQYIASCPQGVSDKNLRKQFTDLSAESIVNCINAMLSEEKISLLKHNNNLVYKICDSVKGLSESDEKIVYQIIKAAGNKGIWVRDIRSKSNLLISQLNKIIKSLETRKIVKSINAVAAAKKKLYMLYELDPDPSLTGGAWYSDQEFESEFVEILSEQCLKFIEVEIELRKQRLGSWKMIEHPIYSYVTSQEILGYIAKLGISKVPLKLIDIEMILEKLIYDNCLIKVSMPPTSLPDTLAKHVSKALTEPHDMLNLYKYKPGYELPEKTLSSANTNPTSPSIPCFGCENLLTKCGVYTAVTAPKCTHINDWLKM